MNRTPPKYFFSICAIVKDEGPYLAEFIEFHLLQGVEHFYLFLNDCTDNTFDVAMKYAKLGFVTIVSWPGKSTHEKSIQLAAYEWFVKFRGTETTWVACIDIDEFLYTGIMQLSEVFKQLDTSVSAVLVNWTLFGSSGHIDYDPESLVIERFTRRAKVADHHVKTIFRPDRFISTGKNVHRFNVKGLTFHSTGNIETDSPWVPLTNEDACFIRLAHFHTKSREEYRKRCERGRADWPIKKDFETNFKAHDVNDVEDLYIASFAKLIRENIAKRDE